MQYSQILWAIFYGWVFFHESVDLPTLIGAGVVIASGLYIVFREATAHTSDNQPVLRTRGRSETVTAPRSSILGRVLGLRARNSRS